MLIISLRSACFVMGWKDRAFERRECWTIVQIRNGEWKWKKMRKKYINSLYKFSANFIFIPISFFNSNAKWERKYIERQALERFHLPSFNYLLVFMPSSSYYSVQWLARCWIRRTRRKTCRIIAHEKKIYRKNHHKY